MSELLNSALAKLLVALTLAAGSSLVTYYVGTAGTVPEARVAAVREQRSELITLVDYFAEHCQPVGPAPAVTKGVSERLSDAAQMQIPLEVR